MKLSTKGRYGLRAMVDLATHSFGKHVSLNSIAERQNVSENYLEQVFSILRKAELVKSVKGAQGGYMLYDSPANIKIGTIIRALEGNLFVIDDGTDIGEMDQTSLDYCIKVNLWDKIDETINSVVDNITLEDLVNEYNRITGNLSTMYYI
jgi:Rrf2 family protein